MGAFNEVFDTGEELYQAIVKYYGAVKEESFMKALEKLDLTYWGFFSITEMKEIVDFLRRSGHLGGKTPRMFQMKKPWFRYSDYETSDVNEDWSSSLGSKGSVVRRTSYIQPAPGAKLTMYDLDDCLDDIVVALTRVPLDEDFNEIPVKEREVHFMTQRAVSRKIKKFEVAGETFALDFAKKYGLLGIQFEGVKNLPICEGEDLPVTRPLNLSRKGGKPIRTKSEEIIGVQSYYTPEIKALDEHFRGFLKEPVMNKCIKENKITSFYQSYREPLGYFLLEAQKFYSWANSFAREWDIEYNISIINSIMQRSSPVLIPGQGNFSLEWGVSSILDGAYLRVVDRYIKAHGFKICQNTRCKNNRMFLPESPRFKYCSTKCQKSAKDRSYRERKKAIANYEAKQSAKRKR